MTADQPPVGEPSISPPGVGSALLAYLWDGVRVPALPVTVIANAANRSLPLATCILVLLILELVAFIPSLGDWLELVSTGAMSMGETLAELGWEYGTGVCYRLTLLAVLYGFSRLLGGQGKPGRFLSAALVVEAFALVWTSVAALASLVAVAFMGDVSTGGALLLGQMGLYAPVLVSVIAIGYMVLVVRFGGLLDYLRAFVTVVATIAVLTLFYWSMPHVVLTLAGLWYGRV